MKISKLTRYRDLNSGNCLLIIILIFAGCLAQLTLAADINPYKILGVPRNADDKQIKKAYRELAKDWHPDKNESPEAAEKFMKINQAYEILVDPERRSLYDDYGTTSEPRNAQPGYGGFHRESNFRDFPFDEFESFFGGGGFRFNFGGGGGGREHSRKNPEEEINKKIYDEEIFPNSNVKPYLIFFYTDFCFSCMSVESVWNNFKQEIKNIGFGAGHSDGSWNRELSRILGINTVPSVVGIINGRVHHFSGEYTVKNLREFVRKLVPAKTVVEVDENNFNTTLHQTIIDNKVLALFVHSSNQLTLRYQMPCFQMSNFIRCSSININKIKSSFRDYLEKNFNLNLPYVKTGIKEEMLVIFKESMFQAPLASDLLNYKPSLVHKSAEISYASMNEIFETNKHHNFPRISSLNHLYDLCPAWTFQSYFETENSKKVYCVLFMANSDSQKPKFLFEYWTKQYSQLTRKLKSEDSTDKKIQFAFIYANVQTDFIEKLVKTSKLKLKENSLDDKILIIKRLDDKYIEFGWIEDIKLDEDLSFFEQLKLVAKQFSTGERKLRFKTTIPNIYRESSQDLITTIVEFINTIWEYVTDRHFWERIVGNNSYLMILLCSGLLLFLMMLFSSEKSVTNNSRQTNNGGVGGRRKEGYYRRNDTSNSSTFSNREDNENYSRPQHNHQDNQQDESNSSSFRYEHNYKPNLFSIMEINNRNYAELVLNLPNRHKAILFMLNDENKFHLLDLFTRVCSKYTSAYKHLHFAYVNQSTPSGRKWLNELVYGKYKNVSDEDDNEDDDNDSASMSSSSSHNLYNEYERIPNQEHHHSNSLKNSNLDRDCLVLCMNVKQNYYLALNLFNSNPECDHDESTSSYLNLHRRNSLEHSLGLDESFTNEQENRFALRLSNWLDRIADGLCDNNKHTVKEWPEYK